MVLLDFVLGEVADRLDDAEVDGHAGQALLDAVPRESVLVGAAGRVVGLAGEADHADERGQHDVEVEAVLRGKVLVQIPAALHLGREPGVVVFE